jgi:hypothetical protein
MGSSPITVYTVRRNWSTRLSEKQLERNLVAKYMKGVV